MQQQPDAFNFGHRLGADPEDLTAVVKRNVRTGKGVIPLRAPIVEHSPPPVEPSVNPWKRKKKKTKQQVPKDKADLKAERAKPRPPKSTAYIVFDSDTIEEAISIEQKGA